MRVDGRERLDLDDGGYPTSAAAQLVPLLSPATTPAAVSLLVALPQSIAGAADRKYE